ncbi:GNAT family N-acetyltransferase [Arthrobacter sp. D2-10]
MTVVIDHATANDAGPLATLAAITFPLACPPTSRPEDIAHFIATELSEERFTQHIADPDKILLCLREDGHLLAWSMLVKDLPKDEQVRSSLSIFPTIELSKFYVHPSQHGQGSAARLMEASLEIASKGTDAQGIWLGTNDRNARAVRFYEKHGFTRVGAKTFQLGSGVETDFVLERALR